MIKAVIFDLDNTLIDFMRMKMVSCDAAINAMIGAGLNIERKKALKVLFGLYDKYGLEEKTIFQKFLKKVAGKVDYRILASGIVAYRRVRKFGIKISMKRMLNELADIKEIMVVYAGNKKKKTRYQVVQSKTSELQQSLLSILNIQKEKKPILG